MDEGIIRSRSNPLVRRLRALKEKAAGELMLLEGPKLIEEALASGVAMVEAAASPRLAGLRGGLVDALRSRGVAVRLVDEGVLASLSEVETSQGILALAHRPAFDEARLYQGTPLVLVAAGIQNPGNLGALLRTAEAAGATGAYLTDGSAEFGVITSVTQPFCGSCTRARLSADGKLYLCLFAGEGHAAADSGRTGKSAAFRRALCGNGEKLLPSLNLGLRGFCGEMRGRLAVRHGHDNPL